MDFRFELPLAPESLALLPGRVKRIWRWPFAVAGRLVGRSAQPLCDSRPLKIDPQGSVERELKGLILCLTHWV